MIVLPRNTSRWVVSADLGQSIDPTAIAVLEVTTRRDVVRNFYAFDDETRPADIEAPPNEWFAIMAGGGLREPAMPVRIDVRHLERLPLRTNYVDVVQHISGLLTRPPLASPRADLVLDQTGVGRPVVDMFRRRGLRPRAVTITGGDGESQDHADNYRVAKLLLVSRLQALLHSGELRIAKGLKEAQNLAFELQDFRASITDSGYTRFGAREGQHDDLVLAVAIGAWWSSRPMFPTVVTTVHF